MEEDTRSLRGTVVADNAESKTDDDSLNAMSRALNGMSRASSFEKGYALKWHHSGDNFNDDESSDDSDEIEEYYDDLPDFADIECREIHRATLEINAKVDKTNRRIKQTVDRLKTMREHMQHLRQEIELTNGLVAASKDDVRAEEHLVALGDRQKAKFLAEINEVDGALVVESNVLKNIEAQKVKASEDTERLKLALNCNQEELEQWAKSASMKEADYISLEKYTRMDDVKIKDLTMKLEVMTMRALEKQVDLENETMETQTRRLELDRCLEMFRKEQKERQSMISQWQETVELMKKRDGEIEELSRKYSDLDADLGNKLQKIIMLRQSLEVRKGNNAALAQDVSICERNLQTKRQELATVQDTYRNIFDEFDLLRMDSKHYANALHESETNYKVSEELLSDKRRQLQQFIDRSDFIRQQLAEENKTTLSNGYTTQGLQRKLKDKEKEHKAIDNALRAFKDHSFKDTQHLADLQRVESNLLSEIGNTQAAGKNLSVKLRQLEDEQFKQNDTLHSITFQVESMESKVARGLGHRSDEEKRHLLKIISELESEHADQVERKKKLVQQFRIAQNELTDWQRRKRKSADQSVDIRNQITAVDHDISSYDQSLKVAVRRKEDKALFHDSVQLEMTRLRNLLYKKIQEIAELQDLKERSSSSSIEEKERLLLEKDIKMSQLKIAKEDLHKLAIEVGQKCMNAQNTRSKYEIICKSSHTDIEGGDDKSNIKSLVGLVQKQAELQQEGDKIDDEISKRERGIISLQKILRSLRARNVEYRKSLSSVPRKEVDKHESSSLANDLLNKETELYELKLQLRHILDQYEADQKKSVSVLQNYKALEDEYEQLSVLKDNMIEEVENLIHSFTGESLEATESQASSD